MIVTLTLALDLDDLLDALDLELLEDEEYDAEYDIDEDLDDWAEVDLDGTVWYLDEETDILYYFDDEADDWVEVEEFEEEEEEEEDDSASW